MRRHLNTLYVTTQGAYLAKDGQTVAVRVEGKTKLRVPVTNLEGVVCFGNVGCSPFVLGHCAKNGVGLSFLTKNGRFLARSTGFAGGNVLLRREQYRRADDPSRATDLARSFVIGKIANCRSVLMRALRDHPKAKGHGEVRRAVNELATMLARLGTAPSLDVLRGMEGRAARIYFGVFDHLILRSKSEFQFKGRSRRPPLDRTNALLSFLYTLLVHDQSSALECVGLDFQVGCLHRDRPGRPGLALDLIEELRPFLADRLALTLINRGRFGPADFRRHDNGAVLLNDEGRKKVLMTYQERKDTTLIHPFLKEKTTIGMLVHLQARLLARHMRGDLDAYPPFFMR